MAVGFVFDDTTLQEMLEAYKADLAAGDTLTLCLFVDDVEPADGHDENAYTEASWPGYVRMPLAADGWGNVAVAAHIASMPFADPPVFEYDAGQGNPVTVYGYFILDGNGQFKMSERVATPKTINPGEGIRVTPRIKLKTCREEL